MDPNMLASMLAAYLMSPQGGGPGIWGDGLREQIKALDSVDKAVMKASEALAPPAGEAPRANPLLAVGNQGGEKSGWDSFLTAMNTPSGGAGLAALLGNFGAAISNPNTWQSRLGATAGQMGSNLVMAEKMKDVLGGLKQPAPTAPPAPPNTGTSGGANFQGALLANPPQALFPELRLNTNPELKLR